MEKSKKSELARLRLFAIKVEKTFEYCKPLSTDIQEAKALKNVIFIDNIADHLKLLKGN